VGAGARDLVQNRLQRSDPGPEHDPDPRRSGTAYLGPPSAQPLRALGNAGAASLSTPIVSTVPVDPPVPGINKIGFIDNSDGANLRTGPREAGGRTVRDSPLPPATQVFVSGTHPQAPQWWYVTTLIDQQLLRGYVQGLRVTIDLPEPTAKLYQVKPGDTAERLAVQEFSTAVRDGHDLRYYENVLLYVNEHLGRAGVTGSYQDPGLFGGGANNVQLVAGHRIWLVSPAFARALEDSVPSGSLTGGLYAKLKRFAQHVEDIFDSIISSPQYLDEVAGEYAQAIRDHLPEIIGIVLAFLGAEALSALLAATPTGVGQLAAAVIQLALAFFGAQAMVTAAVDAVEHASQWLTLAWTASGNQEKIAAASHEFLRMLVGIAMTALAYTGVKGNLGRMATIARNIRPPMAPALATVGGRQLRAPAGALAGVRTGAPGPAGPFAAAMTASGAGKGGGSRKPPSGETPKGEGSQTAAERDWEKSKAQAEQQEAAGAKAERTEHAALREAERGALTAEEQARLQSALPRSQPDGATTKVLREGRGRYTVVTVNEQGQTVTVIRGKTSAELKNLSANHGWDPPWE
jgi:hypothetical protein